MQRAMVAVLLALSALTFTSSASAKIVGGQALTIDEVPWQVFIQADLGARGATVCGGSILNEVTILTAAHCVTQPGTMTKLAPKQVKILAGASKVSSGLPPGSQVRGAKALSVHPNYAVPRFEADIAVIALDAPLRLGRSAEAIEMVGIWQPSNPGTQVSFSGYGKQDQAADANGQLYGGSATVIVDDQCRSALAPHASGTSLCVTGGPPSICLGDSGGPLVDAQGRLAGVTSFVDKVGCARGPAGFTDLAMPEVRVFVDNVIDPAPDAPIPMAPRPTGDQVPTLKGITPPVTGSPITCTPGQWTDTSGGIAYVFTNDSDGAVVQDSTNPTFVPATKHIGASITCALRVQNAGGIAWSRTGTAPAIVADKVRPKLRLRSTRCNKRRCTVRLLAADSNSYGAVKVTVRAKKLTGSRRARRSREFKKIVAGTRYRFTARSPKLRRGRTRILARVTDAAGNRSPWVRRIVRIR